MDPSRDKVGTTQGHNQADTLEHVLSGARPNKGGQRARKRGAGQKEESLTEAAVSPEEACRTVAGPCDPVAGAPV